MERNEQKYAQDLYDGLLARFSPISEQAQIALTGGGVQWRCSAQRGSRSCWIGCFEVGGPEFLTFFEADDKKTATARTSSQPETIEAVWTWLDGAPLSRMYESFAFVDWEKRRLQSLRDDAIARHPNLATAARNDLTVTPSGVSHLWLRTPARSAHIHFISRHQSPEAVFHWDECELFRFEAKDNVSLAAILSRWLADNAPPSTLRKEFPWLDLGRLADFYEKGNPVEGEFIESWDQMEGVYEGSRFPPRTLVLPFIAELRRAGYDRKLRAGQSIWSLVVSRSRRPRLRPEQPVVSFDFREHSMEVYARDRKEERLHDIPIAMSDTVDQVLRHLTEHPVD
ncbi:MAG: hypothetical protein ACLGXA_16200 [Acidobacteriota bacterium]